MKKRILVTLLISALVLSGVAGCKAKAPETTPVEDTDVAESDSKIEVEPVSEDVAENDEFEGADLPADVSEDATEIAEELPEYEDVMWNDDWNYASFSMVHEPSVRLYHARAAVRNGYTVAVNAGHGSRSAAGVKTKCHPDGSAKVTGGSTQAGAVTAVGASSGSQLLDGTYECNATLELALILKDILLANGYDVLMLREEEDCDMDNVARSVYANNAANCHIALHYDSSENDKGFFYTGVPESESYRKMEPVASHWEEHDALGQALVEGEKSVGHKIFSDGRMALDLTQTSYSEVASVDLEVGDRGSDHSQATLEKIANGILAGLNIFFGIK